MTKQEEVEEKIKAMIGNQLFKPGEKIVSIRQMAKISNTSVTPVVAAYRQLEEDGIIESRPKSGYFVAVGSAVQSRDAVSSYMPLFSPETDVQTSLFCRAADSVYETVIKYPFARTYTPSHLTDPKFIHAFTRGINDYACRSDVLLWQDNEQLTSELVRWMLHRKCTVSQDDISVTASLTQSVILALYSCITRSDSVAVAVPCSAYAVFAAKLFGARIVPMITSVESGLDMDFFERSVENDRSIRCLICSPNFGIPTGSIMPYDRKSRLVEFCAANDIVIIEDDSMGDFSFTDHRPIPLKGLNPDGVIYVSEYENHMVQIGWISGGKYHSKIKRFAEINHA